MEVEGSKTDSAITSKNWSLAQNKEELRSKDRIRKQNAKLPMSDTNKKNTQAKAKQSPSKSQAKAMQRPSKRQAKQR